MTRKIFMVLSVGLFVLAMQVMVLADSYGSKGMEMEENDTSEVLISAQSPSTVDGRATHQVPNVATPIRAMRTITGNAALPCRLINAPTAALICQQAPNFAASAANPNSTSARPLLISNGSRDQ